MAAPAVTAARQVSADRPSLMTGPLRASEIDQQGRAGAAGRAGRRRRRSAGGPNGIEAGRRNQVGRIEDDDLDAPGPTAAAAVATLAGP